METLAAISLVGNIVQFVNFGSKLISKSVQLYRSSHGALPENIDIEMAANHLVLLNSKLRDSANTTGDVALKNLCISCSTVAVELLGALDKLKVPDRQTRWESMRKAIQSVWSKEDIQRLEKRLGGFREELNLQIVVGLREQICQVKLGQADLLKSLDITAQKILHAIENQNDVFQVALHEQVASIGTQVADTRAGITQEIKFLKLDANLTEQERRLTKLHVHDAAFNSRLWEHEPRCLPETRVDLLQQIMTWSEDSSGACIFWLNGMAGTGKSTIARTVARAFADQNRLGASFFFSRGQRDLDHAGKFFTTLAAQLSHTLPPLKPYVCRAMAENFNISSSGLGEQWKCLIFQPLSNLQVVSPLMQILIFVVDALDECEDDRDVRLILQLLTEVEALKTVQIRVFVTSRPEIPIRLGFRNMSRILHYDLRLHDVPRAIVDGDISTFFEHKFGEIRSQFEELPVDWPGKHNIDLLVHRAGGLFIYAATVCRFVEDNDQWPPQDLLSLFLPSDTTGDSLIQERSEVTHKSPMWELDEIYLRILEYSFKKVSDELDMLQLVEIFRKVVGSIAVLSEPLSVASIAGLLAMRRDVINRRLRHLHSVIYVPESQRSPIRLLHPSFRDFLLDKQRCRNPQFWVDKKKTHEALAKSCLELMSNHLRNNMCDLRMPGALVTEIEKGKVEECLPLDVQYACRCWVYHLRKGNNDLYSNDQVHTFLGEHFLHWLEALSLIGNMSDGVIMVRTLESMLTPKCNTKLLLLEMIHDAKRFVLSYRYIIEKAPLQVYNSALLFSSKRSIVRKQYMDQFPTWIKSLSMVEEDWNPSLQALEGHSGGVRAVVFSPDGQLLASASYDKTVRLWDPKTGVLFNTLEDHSGAVNTVAFSPDGHLLASASDDSTVRLWDPKTEVSCGILEGHSATVNAVAFSPDGQLLASVSNDRVIKLWEPRMGALRSTFKGHSGSVNAIAFSPDGQLLASTSYDKTIILWDLRSRAPCGTLEGHSDSVMAVTFSPDSQLLASASDDKTVKLWNSRTGALRSTLEGHLDRVNAVAFSLDGQLLASASFDNIVRFWDLRTEALYGILEGHSDGVRSVAFSPDGQLLTSASHDKTIKLWDSRRGVSYSAVKSHSDWVRVVAFSSDGQLLVSTSYDETIRLWDLRTGVLRSTLEGHSGWVNAVAFSPNGQFLASASDDKTVRLWNPRTGVPYGTLKGHMSVVNAVAFSADSRLLASASDDNTIRLWNSGTVKSCGILEGHSGWVKAVVFSSDGRLLASTSDDNTVRLWDPRTGALCGTLKGHSGWVRAVAFSPDSQLLASGSYDKTVRLWDPKTGASYSTLEGHLGKARVVVFSPDGQLLASASYDNDVRLWDPKTGALYSILKGHSGWVSAVAFSPNGQLLASASDDYTVRLWDPRTGVSRGTIEGHSSWVIAVAFSPDGQLLTSVAYDNNVRLWDIKTRDEIQVFNVEGFTDKPSTPSYLNTNHEVSATNFLHNSFSQSQSNSSSHLYVNDDWVAWKTDNILWLPPDYRPIHAAVRNNILALGHRSGRVTFIEFDSFILQSER